MAMESSFHPIDRSNGKHTEPTIRFVKPIGFFPPDDGISIFMYIELYTIRIAISRSLAILLAAKKVLYQQNSKEYPWA
jgi:hypothetical protein